MMKKIVLGLIFLRFLSVYSTFADTITTDQGVNVDSSFYDAKTDGKVLYTTPDNSNPSATPDGYKVGDKVDTSDTYGGNSSLYQAGTANTTPTSGGSSTITSSDYQKGIDAAQANLDAAKAELNAGPPTQATLDKIANAEAALKTYQAAADKAAEAERDAECAASESCIDKTSFAIDTSLFSVGGNGLKGYSGKQTMDNLFGAIIQKFMIALGLVALFVMTIGAGYMIMYQGHDEYLSKGKNIFMGGITALVVSLCSYYLVNLVGYILYK